MVTLLDCRSSTRFKSESGPFFNGSTVLIESLVFDTPQVFNFLKADSDAALLPG